MTTGVLRSLKKGGFTRLSNIMFMLQKRGSPKKGKGASKKQNKDDKEI